MKIINNVKSQLNISRIRYLLILVVIVVVSFSGITFSQNSEEYPNSSSQKSSILAITLSMQPLPIDFGNMYAGYWDKAVLYSAIELGLFIPGVIMATNGSNSGDTNDFGLYPMIFAYVLTKVISSFDVGINIGFENYSIPDNKVKIANTKFHVSIQL